MRGINAHSDAHTHTPHENIHRLLKGALREGAVAVAINAVARDGHQVTAGSHDIAQNGKVPARQRDIT